MARATLLVVVRYSAVLVLALVLVRSINNRVIGIATCQSLGDSHSIVCQRE